MDIITIRGTGIRAELTRGIILKYPFTVRRLACHVPLPVHEQQDPYFFNKPLIQSAMSVTFFSPFFGALWVKKRTQNYVMQDGATAHIAIYSINILNEVSEDTLMSHKTWPARAPDLNPYDFHR
jgi:hypothetical protein